MINIIHRMTHVGNDSTKDWTNFCLRVSWQNLVQSSLLGYRQGVTAERIGPNFARECPGKI